VARYLKSSDYKSAADVLSNGALLLLNAGQGGSGGDLAMMLLNDVYVKGEYECNKENKDRLLEVLHAFPKTEPTRKRFVQEMINWSGKHGEIERGDSELHHEAGKMYAQGQHTSLRAGPHILTIFQKAMRTMQSAISSSAPQRLRQSSLNYTTPGTKKIHPT